jgi:hypothetical protein
MAKMTAFTPPPQVDLGNGYVLYAPEGMRHTMDGVTAAVHLFNGKIRARLRVPFNDDAQVQAFAEEVAKKTQLPVDTVKEKLLELSELVEEQISLQEAKNARLAISDRYVINAQGIFLKHSTAQGDYEELLANFHAVISKDITYDDDTPDLKRSFVVEATLQGTTTRRLLTEREFYHMAWPTKLLGAEAMMDVGPFKMDHVRLAIQSHSTADKQTIFMHTGWRCVVGEWCFLHAGGAITASGLRDDIAVELPKALAAYHLPAPSTDPQRIRDAVRASLGLRNLDPSGPMVVVLGTTYLAPLRPFLIDHLPDFVAWIGGPSGRFKTEYAVLGMQHFGSDFSSRHVPANFIATGNSLERLSYIVKDALLLVDDYYPASDHRTRDAMEMTVGRLLRGIGNQTGRARMRADTSLQTDLPPRCVALATGERSPEGHSSNARLLLQYVDLPADVTALKERLSTAQAAKDLYSEATAIFIQYLAQHWDEMEATLAPRFRALRTEAAALGTHSREPGHIAHMQLAWETFTACAVHVGALSDAERTIILDETWKHLQGLVADQGALLHDETTTQRFLGLLMAGFASKRLYLSQLDDQPPLLPEPWGWTARTETGFSGQPSTTYAVGQAKKVGYLDDDFLYLIPATLHEYLHQTLRAAGNVWSLDKTTLYRELDEAHLLMTKTVQGSTERTILKKVQGNTIRLLHIKRPALERALETDAHAPSPGTQGSAEPSDDDGVTV